jgi:hypothetical protein
MPSPRRLAHLRLRSVRRSNIPRGGRGALVPTPVVVLSDDVRCVTLRMPVVALPSRLAEAIERSRVEPRSDASIPQAIREASGHDEEYEPPSVDAFEPWTPPARALRSRLAVFVVGVLAAVALIIAVVGTRTPATVARPAVRDLPVVSRAVQTTAPAPLSAPPSAAPVASAVVRDVAATPAPTATPPVPRDTAAGEKRRARAALEGGSLRKAVTAGERSVELDPTDAEAWLLLGAAYEMRGLASDARRAYSSCARQGRSGPVAECRAMLQ